jgi:acyl carrier protein
VGEKRLVAYVVPTTDQRATIGAGEGEKGRDDELVVSCVALALSGSPALAHSPSRQSSLISELRGALREKLPEYMVPSAFVVLDALPKTPNGKVDRKALPAPELRGSELEERFVAPRTPVEEVLARLWSQMLRVERVGVYDNFFELGGHSLLATQLITRLRATFQVDLPLRSLFEATTVAELARIIVAHEVKPGQSEKIARVLKRLDAMSAEDARALLQKKEQETSVK